MIFLLWAQSNFRYLDHLVVKSQNHILRQPVKRGLYRVLDNHVNVLIYFFLHFLTYLLFNLQTTLSLTVF